MSRGSFRDAAAVDTACVSAARTGPDEHGPWVWQETVYGGVRRFHLRPQEYATPLLARRLADKWLEIAPEIRGSVGPVHTAVRGFLTDLGRQVRDSGRDGDFDLPDLRRRHLDGWETGLLADQRTRGTDTAYQRAVHLFALLRRIDHDTPGILREEVVARLERDTRLSHVRRGGEPEFPPQEAERLRDAARSVVKRALAGHRDADTPRAPAADVIVALHVLLSLGTGEPPEVLRRLDIGDIVATAIPGADDGLHHLDPADRLATLVRRRAVHSWCVHYVKARSAERYQQVYTRRDKQVFGPLSALVTLTAGARRGTGSSRLWLMDRYGAAVEPCWGRKTVSLRAWAARNLSGTEPGSGLSEPVVFRRLRKSVTTAEALADPAGYLRSGRRHNARTFFEHYSNSGVLRAQAGRILMQAIGERFDTAVAGPTVVTSAAQEVLAAGGDAPGLDQATAERLLVGQLDTGIAACRDPLDSPHAAPGQPCPVATTGDCYSCPNALITRDHLPAVLRLHELTHPDRAGNVAFWQQRWKPVHEFITRVVLPAFTTDEITPARAAAGDVLLDVGLVNDLAGTDAPR